MKYWMEKLKAWFWVIAGALAVGLIFILQLLSKRRLKEGEPFLPPVPEALLVKKHEAQMNAVRVRAETKATTELKQAELAKITEIEDEKERMRKLADFIRNT